MGRWIGWIGGLLFLVVSLAVWAQSSPYKMPYYYVVLFKGVSSRSLVQHMREASQLEALHKRPPSYEGGLLRRADGDIPVFKKILESYGYYDAQIKATVVHKEGRDVVVLDFILGTRYQLASYKMISVDGPLEQPIAYSRHHKDKSEHLDTLPLSVLHIALGQPAIARGVVDGEKRLLTLLNNQGYPFAQIANREVTVDKEAKQMHVVLFVQHGALTYFGPTTFDGLHKTKLSFVQRRLQWKEGDIYSLEKVNRTYATLDEYRMFATTNIMAAPEEEQDHHLPIKVFVTESKSRSIDLGVSYSTSDEFGVSVGWEYRNWHGCGDAIELATNLSDRLQEIALTYERPDVWKVGDDLESKVWGRKEFNDSYDVESIGISGLLERSQYETLEVNMGALITRMRVRESADGNGFYDILNFPLSLTRFWVDHPADPHRGVIVKGVFTPVVNLLATENSFAIGGLRLNSYIPLSKNDKWVGVAWAEGGTLLLSPARYKVPPPYRFYGGGEDNLRGYDFRTVSPLDAQGRPLGGRSAFYYGTELRYAINETIGIVGFMDFGNTYEDLVPNALGKPFKSVGIGGRCTLPGGAIRIDLGFPLDRRPSLDSQFQIYFSAGRTF